MLIKQRKLRSKCSESQETAEAFNNIERYKKNGKVTESGQKYINKEFDYTSDLGRDPAKMTMASVYMRRYFKSAKGKAAIERERLKKIEKLKSKEN